MGDDRANRGADPTGSTVPLAAAIEQSLAGHSAPDLSATTAPSQEHGRYRELEVVGEGGLGTVLRARDELLGRDVALKRIGPRARGGSPADVHERFLREARITARLDHPGIVPVHDAGVTHDGRMYYTMRLIRGRSLGEVAEAAATPEARLALVGAITAACHAVGYAHREGVIHRDLKPANIMIGALGETQVVDWGLAEVLAERDAPTGFAGTLAYASPELVRGEAASRASDVWALGVTLHQVITGNHRFEATYHALEATLRAEALPPASWPDTCPPELAAIGDRAMARDPTARYPDAHAMALDLEAFRDGRRVTAHRYAASELLRRFVVAWRWPLAALATLVIGTVAALGMTAYRTERQRVRAVSAERATADQLHRTEAALADALAKDAAAALRVGAIARAERTAVAALAHGEHPDARGVLAAVHAAPRPRTSRHVAIAGCRQLAAISDTTAACLERDRLEVWDLPDRAPPVRRWVTPLAAVGAIGLGERWLVAWTADATLYVLDAASGAQHGRSRPLVRIAAVERSYTGARAIAHDGRTVVAFDRDGGTAIEPVCGERGIDAAATTDQETFVVCAGGRLGRYGARGFSELELTGFGTEIPAATALALSETGFDLAIGGAGGDVQVRDLRGCFAAGCEPPSPVMLTHVVATPIRKLACLGRDVIAIGDRGDAAHIGRGTIGELTRLPITADRPISFLEGGDVAVGGEAHHVWTIDGAARPSRLVARRGLIMAAVGTTRVAGVTDEGEVVTWDPRSGERVAIVEAAEAVAIGLTGDGAQLAVATPAEVTVRDPSGAVIARYREAGTRQLGFVDGGWIAIGDGWLRTLGADRRTIPRIAAAAIVAPAVWVVDPELVVWRIHGAETLRVGTAIGSLAIAASASGNVATAAHHRVRLASPTGPPWELAIDDGEVSALALDEARLAIATSRGVIEIWDIGARRLRARMTNLDQRARWLALRGDELWSAGDDGGIRRWDLAVLARPPAALAATAAATWGP